MTTWPLSTLGRPVRAAPARWAAELWSREPRLALFGTVLLALLLPMAMAAALDPRELRGAGVWVKPMKFALSVGVFALTTAWFVGHLHAAHRRSRAVDRIVALLIATGSFELAYIMLQAALGEASHYNVGDAFHGAMYTAMGIAAVALTGTQALLAWQLHRHPDPARPATLRAAVITGLVLTFVLGTASGVLLGGMQPPASVSALPVVGWSLEGGDLRPAHFAGLHAQQVLPAVGMLAVTLGPRRGKRVLAAATIAYIVGFAALVAWGLSGRG